MRAIHSVTIGAAAVLFCACATTAPTSGGPSATYNDCIFAGSLRDWRPLDDENLILFGDGRRPYHVELVRPAMGLTFDVMIGVYDRDGRICPFGGDAIVIDGPIPEQISIRSIRRLSDEQLDAVYVEFGIEAPAVIEATEVDGGEAQAP